MEKNLVDIERFAADIGIVNDDSVDETDLEEQEVVMWEELMKK